MCNIMRYISEIMKINVHCIPFPESLTCTCNLCVAMLWKHGPQLIHSTTKTHACTKIYDQWSRALTCGRKDEGKLRNMGENKGIMMKIRKIFLSYLLLHSFYYS